MAAFGMDTIVGLAGCPSLECSTGVRRFQETGNGTLPTCENYAECVGNVLFFGSANYGSEKGSRTESGVFWMNRNMIATAKTNDTRRI
jgi:hypothetical protein